MRLVILASGQIKGSPEAALFDTYETWIKRRGRPIGITQLDHIELKGKKSGGRAADERDEIAHAMNRITDEDPQTFFVLLDERGETLSSVQFSDHMRKWCDADLKTLCFVLGAADGFDDALRSRAHFLLSLGRMSWPHLLARALLAEQIWRAISILTNHPYHRA